MSEWNKENVLAWTGTAACLAGLTLLTMSSFGEAEAPSAPAKQPQDCFRAAVKGEGTSLYIERQSAENGDLIRSYEATHLNGTSVTLHENLSTGETSYVASPADEASARARFDACMKP